MTGERGAKEREGEAVVRQVLVAVGASSTAREALEEAVELAATLGAELRALFVHEPALRLLAEHPLTSELYLGSGLVRTWNAELLRLQLRARMAQTHRLLERLAQRRSVRRWSLEVAEGDVTTVLLQATQAGVLTTVLGRDRWSFPAEARARRAWGELLAKSKGLTLVHRRGRLDRLPAVVFYDGSESSRRALGLLGRLRKRRRQEVRVLLPPVDEASLQQLRRDVERWAEASGLIPRMQRLGSVDAEDVARVLAGFREHFVMLPSEAPELETTMVQAALDSAAAVLVVRA